MKITRDTIRDPRGALLGSLPWPLRRLYFALQLREWPWRIPASVNRIGCRRPPQAVFDAMRRDLGLDAR